MKKILAGLALAGLAGLTACTPAAGPTTETSAPPTEPSGASAASPSSSKSASAAGTAGVKESCEAFNALIARYGAAKSTDANAFEDIYLKSEEAKDAAPAEVSGLFAALSLLAIDHSSVAETNGQPEQASKDAVRDAVFASAGACTAEGVTLKL